jgi:chemotaxis regulatin CheY-phosphate phosphatase CheZ
MARIAKRSSMTNTQRANALDQPEPWPPEPSTTVDAASVSAELTSLVAETEAAVHRIINVAEALRGTQFGSVEEYRAFNAQQAVALLEASCFQDLTGQRTSKIVNFLNQLGLQLLTLGQWLGQAKSEPAVAPPRPKTGLDQRDVDALFAEPPGAPASHS